jgi:hypothetical protein
MFWDQYKEALAIRHLTFEIAPAEALGDTRYRAQKKAKRAESMMVALHQHYQLDLTRSSLQVMMNDVRRCPSVRDYKQVLRKSAELAGNIAGRDGFTGFTVVDLIAIAEGFRTGKR